MGTPLLIEFVPILSGKKIFPKPELHSHIQGQQQRAECCGVDVEVRTPCLQSQGIIFLEKTPRDTVESHNVGQCGKAGAGPLLWFGSRMANPPPKSGGNPTLRFWGHCKGSVGSGAWAECLTSVRGQVGPFGWRGGWPLLVCWLVSLPASFVSCLQWN